MNASLIAIAAAALAMPAFAQDATVAGPAAAQPETAAAAPAPIDETPGEIVVTAQKRTERLQDVPVAVSVISGAALAAKGAVNLENAQYLVPTLNFRKSGTSINQSLFLRGVGTTTFSIAGEPSISTVVDGVVYSRAGEAFSDLVDIDRIEVLRGPQGTLFGKNASAGVINIVTKRPAADLGGFAEASYFSREEYRGRIGLDLPLSDQVRTRVTGFYGNYDGNIRNVTVGRRVNGYEHYGVRGVLEVTFTPDVLLTVIADWRKAKDDCCGEVIGTAPANAAATVLPTPRGDETRALAQNLVTSTIERSYGVSGQLDWSFAPFTVTSITAYRNYRNREIRDGDFLPAAYVGLNQLHDDGPQTGNTFSQELRLTSPGQQFIEYVVGGYYSRAESERTFTRNDIVCNASTTPNPLVPCGAAGAPASTFPSGTATFGSLFRNYAAFGQLTANLTDEFRLIGGLRYTKDKLSVFHSRRTTLTGPGINPNFDQGVFNEYIRLVGTGLSPTVAATQAASASNGVPFRTRTSNDNLSGKVGAQYDLTRDNTLYATFARGYKGPAYNIFFNLTGTGTNEIEAETSESYEVGLKNSLDGGRFVLNLAAYYAKYKNFQANNPDVVAGVLVTRFTNAGTISTRGVELDLIWRPVRDLNLSGGVAYTDAKVDRFRAAPNAPATAIIPAGTTLAYAPKWKGSLVADYVIRTGGAVDVALGASGSIQSKQLSQFDASAAVRAATTIGGYGLVDLSAGIVSADDRFRLTAQVKNVFDTSFAAAIANLGPGGSYRYLIPREADRYYGVTGRVNF